MASLPLTAEQMWHLIADDALDAFVISDHHNGVVAWSSYAETLFGWSAEEAIGKSLTSLIIPPQYHEAHNRGVEQYLKTGHLSNLRKRVEVMALHKDGHCIAVELSVTPIHLNEQVYFTASIRDNSERKKNQEKLEEQAALLDLTHDAIMVLSLQDEVIWWNKGAEAMFGFTQQEAIGKKRYELLHTEFPLPREQMKQAFMLAGHWEGELTHRKSDNTLITTFSRWILQNGKQDEPGHILVSATDITLLKQNRLQQTLLNVFEQRFKSLFDDHPDGVFALNSEPRLISANAALAAFTGYTVYELTTSPRARIIAPESLQEIDEHIALALTGKPQTCEAILVRKDATRFEAFITMVPIIVDGEVYGVHGLIKDISHQKETERKTYFAANHDQLTGLPNRNLLEDRMQHAIEQARRLGTHIAVLFMDLNKFKFVNDTLGHDVGDMLLCEIAQRIKSSIREIDTVARIGGDEFIVVLENVHHDAHDISIVADNLLKTVSQPVILAGHELVVSTSIGASIFPLHGNDLEKLVKLADLAMYEAKAAGPGNFRLYAGMSHKTTDNVITFTGSLKRALKNNELILHYQPRFDLATHSIVGLEALVRWKHPEKGLIYPADFLADVENEGLLDKLDEWVLENACRHNKAWQAKGLKPIKISVNFSLGMLNPTESILSISNALSKTGLDPCFLGIEIAESRLTKNPAASVELMKGLRDLGVSALIDDFGTGQCSVVELLNLQVDAIKIDNSFVEELSSKHKNATLVTATIAMAHEMHLKVIAEGVSTTEEMDFLKRHGCDEIQGYLFSQPVPTDKVEDFLTYGANRTNG